MMQKRTSRAFSLIELTMVLAVVASASAVLAPSLSRVRSSMQGMTSEGNLLSIGQGSGMYALDNGDRIFTYSWRAGVPQLNIRSGNMIVPASDSQAASYQARDILWRSTGRINGPGRLFAPLDRLMHRRYSHLVLADYLGGNVSDPLWVDPADAQQLSWQANPLEYLEDNNTIPYGVDYPSGDYESSFGWDDVAVRQFWTYGSSYQQSNNAWLFDDVATYTPQFETPHLYANRGHPSGANVAQRFTSEVRFPSAKVFMFEEFDREQNGMPYFMYDHAAPAKLMFDGSINTAMTGLARPGVNPGFELHDRENDEQDMYYQIYLPLDKFPLPVFGSDKDRELIHRYRWTSGGLSGLDYPQVLSRP
jgi:prepilin-type N-terminal cleavage/methylation domain-containing protein